jgi:hypothetical protein
VSGIRTAASTGWIPNSDQRSISPASTIAEFKAALTAPKIATISLKAGGVILSVSGVRLGLTAVSTAGVVNVANQVFIIVGLTSC